MEKFLSAVKGISKVLNAVAGVALVFLMLLTIADVILRLFRMPITGTYELVAFSGAVVIGFAIATTSWERQHIFVDFFINKFSQGVRNFMNVLTRLVVIALFVLVSWNMFKYAMDLKRSNEVSLTLQMPFYPIAFGVAGCFVILCLVYVCDIIKIFRGEYENV